MQIAIAACLLLTLGVGGFIGWNVVHLQQSVAMPSGGITPPLGPRLNGPLPTGTRFVFLRDGALWSGSTDTTGGTASVNAPARLTSTNVIVSSHWSVQPTFSGHVAGTMLAYIDLKQGRVHIIRSDGQSDTAIVQPLFASNGTPTSQWNTPTGTSILDSLAWSPDGSQLAFIAAPTGIAHVYVYKLDTTHLEMMPLSPQGEVLSLNWTSVTNGSILTWSMGTVGHIHAILQQQLGTSASSAKTIGTGDYAEATYNTRVGSWLLISQGHDVFTLTTSGILNRLTTSGSASSAMWSPQGSYISYFGSLNAGNGEYHIIDLATGSDTHIASSVATNVAPVWSPDEKDLLYTDGTYISVTSIDGSSTTSIRLPGVTLLAWNPAAPHQAIIELQGSKSGIYLLDTIHKTVTQVSKSSVTSPILWTEIP